MSGRVESGHENGDNGVRNPHASVLPEINLRVAPSWDGPKPFNRMGPKPRFLDFGLDVRADGCREVQPTKDVRPRLSRLLTGTLGCPALGGEVGPGHSDSPLQLLESTLRIAPILQHRGIGRQTANQMLRQGGSLKD